MSGWHVSSTKNGAAYDIGAADGANIAIVHGPADGGPEEFREFAHLIAAAPDMLAALKAAFGAVKNGASRSAAEAAADDLIRAATAKAEGRP